MKKTFKDYLEEAQRIDEKWSMDLTAPHGALKIVPDSGSKDKQDSTMEKMVSDMIEASPVLKTTKDPHDYAQAIGKLLNGKKVKTGGGVELTINFMPDQWDELETKITGENKEIDFSNEPELIYSIVGNKISITVV